MTKLSITFQEIAHNIQKNLKNFIHNLKKPRIARSRAILPKNAKKLYDASKATERSRGSASDTNNYVKVCTKIPRVAWAMTFVPKIMP